MPGFSLNLAVDFLLKKEFDLLRQARRPHELMKKYGIDALPFAHPELDLWRDNFKGIRCHHPPTNLIVTGAVDDLWENSHGELLVVDYKSTSTEKEISLNDTYKQGYKKQLEVYQWLLRQLGFKVSNLGCFVFANAGKNRPSFDGRLEFELSIIPYVGETLWVEPLLLEIKKCLESPPLPPAGKECEYCAYREAAAQKAVAAGTAETLPLFP